MASDLNLHGHRKFREVFDVVFSRFTDPKIPARCTANQSHLYGIT
jgi:hypothetical protein